MSEELWANPEDVLGAISGIQFAQHLFEPIAKPNLGSASASVPFTNLSNLLEQLPTIVGRETDRLEKIVRVAMIDLVEADRVVCAEDDQDRRVREMDAFWAGHGDTVSRDGVSFEHYDDCDDFCSEGDD